MSATYCFTDRQEALFTEAVARGWVAAWRDYPQFKDHEARSIQVLQACEALWNDTCCIPDATAYQTLVTAAWNGSYESAARAQKQLTEYETAMMAATLKHLPVDEALRIMRPQLSSGALKAEIERAYGQFLQLAAR